MKTREEILAANPLDTFLSRRGVQFKGKMTNQCPITEHKPGHPCVTLELEKGLWHCHDCKEGGSVIDWLMKAEGIDAKAALEQLSGDSFEPFRRELRRVAGREPKPQPPRADSKIVATYDYADATGRLLYQVVRFEPKDFRQRRPKKEGGWDWSLNGTARVLYNLAAVKAADFVWLVEGEKDADLLNQYKQVATTNAGGADKWERQYSEQLAGKEVLICGDNDAAGQKHVEKVMAELKTVARSIRLVKVPEGYKDLSEFVASFDKPSAGLNALMDIAENSEPLFRGAKVPVKTMAEMEASYKNFVKRADTVSLYLGSWLPTLAYAVRPLVPGEMVSIVADTGVGKTMLLQNIALSTRLPTLLFEMELPDTLTFERFAGMATKSSGRYVFDSYKNDTPVDWRSEAKLDHVCVCPESRLTPADIERIIEGAGIKTTHRPVVVMLDYVQLIRGAGKSRYETMSSVAEELKVIAKATNTILIIASQVARKGDDHEIGLHDAKDSGSIENSCGLVLGAWRDGDDKDRMMIKVLKNTKGHSGRIIPCRIFDSMLVTEEAPNTSA